MRRTFHRQKRYIGRVIKAGPLFWIEKEYTEERLEQQAENFEEAIDLLYVLCRMSGYLTQGHENCLRGAEKVGARSYLGSARGRAASASSIRHYNTNNELAGTGSCLHYG